jgi:hypothetical protein
VFATAGFLQQLIHSVCIGYLSLAAYFLAERDGPARFSHMHRMRRFRGALFGSGNSELQAKAAPRQPTGVPSGASPGWRGWKRSFFWDVNPCRAEK